MAHWATWWCCHPFTLRIKFSSHASFIVVIILNCFKWWRRRSCMSKENIFVFLSFSFLFSFLPGKVKVLKKKSVSLWIFIVRTHTLDIGMIHMWKKECNLRKTRQVLSGFWSYLFTVKEKNDWNLFLRWDWLHC